MSKRVVSIVTALAFAAALPVVASPARAAAPSSTVDEPAQRSDSRPDPLATERSTERQNAVDELLTGDAKVRGKGPDRVIRLTDGTEVVYPTDETAQLLTFLVDFGDGTENPAYPDQTAGPTNNTIPAPGPSDNSTYWKDPATGGFSAQHYLDMFFNGMEEQDGESFKDLYREMSSGRFDLEGDVSDWVTVPHPEAYYNDADGIEDQPEMTAFIGDSATAWYDAQVAAGKTDSQIKDYLQDFDQWDRYDYDGDGITDEPDGYIDHFQAIHAGEGEEAQAPGEDTWMIWSHRWAANQDGFGVDGPTCSGCNKLGGVEIGDTGFWIRDYTTEPENGGLGVFAHEFGHDLGLPDFYDTDAGRTDDNGAGFWTLMSSGSWLSQEGAASGTTPNHMGPAEKLFLGWYGENDLALVDGMSDDPVEVTLGPSTRATTKGDQVVAVELPDGLSPAVGPATGSTDDDYLYSGDRTQYSATATSPEAITIPPGDSTLTARVAYDIESDYDYAYLQVSPDGTTWENVETSLSTDTNPRAQNLGHGVTGDSGGHGVSWQPLTADLSAYEGAEVELRWKYVTDQQTTYAGLMVDDLEIGDYSTEFDPASGWVLGGFHLVEDGSYEAAYSRYYLAENRQYRDYDATLESGPYSANYADFNHLDHFPYQDGLLVWYNDGRYADNNTSAHPGGGMALPVDASPTNLLWEPQSGPGVLASSRLQTFDSTFDVDETDAVDMARGDQTLDVPAHPSVPVFEDADPEAYLDESGGPGGLWYSTAVSGLGSEIQVLSSNETTGVMKLKVGKRFVAATSAATIDGDESLGGTLTATPPTWFQDDVTSTVAWLRDGAPIPDADGTEYEVTADDVGHVVSAEVTGAKDDYTDTTVVSAGIEAVAAPAPVPDSQPSITGTTQVGQTLTAHAAGWPVDGDSTFSWAGGGPAETSPTYVVKPADLGHEITLTERFSSPGYTTATATATSAEITPGTAPHATAGPGIDGTAQVGQALTAVKATWPVVGDSTFAWTVGGAPVGTGTTYAVKPADLGKPVTVTETFASPGYDVATVAADSAAVIPGAAPTASARPWAAGTARVGSTLKASGATWPRAGVSTFAWSVGGKTVGTGTSYVVRPADVGKQLILTETLTSPGYDNGTSSTLPETVSKGPVKLSVATGKAKKGKKVSVTVTAKSGRKKVPGKVKLTYAGRKVGTRTLKNGKLTVKLPKKQRGSYWLTISYTGAAAFAKAGKTVAIKVK